MNVHVSVTPIGPVGMYTRRLLSLSLLCFPPEDTPTREYFLLCFEYFFSKWFKFVVLSILLFQ